MKKLLSTTIAVGILTSMAMTPAMADVAANALPSLNNATNADVTVGTTNNMNIQIQGGQGGVGTLNWNSFNVGKDASVNFEFSAHNQTALNKVAASGGLSQIYGSMTNSGCQGCGYAGTGKVILLNPNGVLFGDGANVNLNSFTVSNMDGVFNKDKNQLELTKGSNQTDFGISVLDGAKIYGDKNVTFASNNINIYKGSQISTNTAANFGDTAYGKVKLVTADGVNFEYYNNGAVKNINNPVTSADNLTMQVNGNINSGSIDVRNYSTNADAELNLGEGAVLKATKAAKGNDGNIWLLANNKVVAEKAVLQTVNGEGAENAAGGNIYIKAGDKASVASSNLDAVGDITIISQNNDVVVEGSKVTTPKNITLDANRTASAQKNSELTGAQVVINGKNKIGNVNGAKIKADDITVNGKTHVNIYDADLTATNKIKGTAEEDYVYTGNASYKADKIELTAGTKIYGDADLNNNLTELNAGDTIDVNLKNVANPDKGLVAVANNDVTITTDGTLSAGHLVTKKGNMTLNADKVIAGRPYTTEEKIPNGDESPRSYIYVKNGKFTSNTANDSFEVTASDMLNEDGTAQLRHHIQYGNGEEKILLINPRPYTAPEPVTPPPAVVENPDVDTQQAELATRLPRQPEIYNNNTAVKDARTSFVDVFAAASQIEIEDDEEE